MEGEEEIPEEEPAPPMAEQAPLTPREEVPITVSVQVGQVKLPAEKLLGLEAGNTLELVSDPGERVELVVEGKRVARGELLRVGEALGVRILELG